MKPAGSVIREYREKAKMSQADVALALRKSEGAVSQWEVGRTHPRRAVALQLDQLLGASGEIASALGYALPDSATSELTDLKTRVWHLEMLVNALWARADIPAGFKLDEMAIDAEQYLSRRQTPASPPVKVGHISAVARESVTATNEEFTMAARTGKVTPPPAASKRRARPSPPAEQGDHIEE